MPTESICIAQPTSSTTNRRGPASQYSSMSSLGSIDIPIPAEDLQRDDPLLVQTKMLGGRKPRFMASKIDAIYNASNATKVPLAFSNAVVPSSSRIVVSA